MHNEDYIASGILELYAAGGLSQAERDEVERHAAASPEIRLALDEACAAMENYARLYATQPKTELKNRIFNKIGNPLPEQEPILDEELPVVPLYPENYREASAYKWMFAASIVLFLISGFVSYHFYSKWQQAEERLAGVIASERVLAQNFRTTTLKAQQQQKTLSILRNPDFKLLRLQGVEAHPDASMLVYWNPDLQDVYVDEVALPAAPTGKQYQLWALKDGKPIDAGMIVITDGKASLQQMKKIQAAEAFAVTLEPTGGSAQPTLEQLTVIGNIKS